MWSHPTWVRGLKQYNIADDNERKKVAPYMGAWIETHKFHLLRKILNVAPYMGAWIETY